MKVNVMQKLVQGFLVLGLSLNGFCVNLLAPQLAMAMPAVAPAATHEMGGMREMERQPVVRDAMVNTEAFTDCANMDLGVGYNCCFAPNKHGSEKTFESRASVEHRNPVKTAPVKFEIFDPLKGFENGHFRRFHRYGGFSFSSDLTGQIVKRE